jgi:NADH:ubiquinone oxidoreductase subunit C
MNRDEVLRQFRERFDASIVHIEDRSPRRVYVEVRPEALVPVAAHFFRELGARFNTASGVDTPAHLEILYHFTIEEIDLLVSVRVKLSRDRPSVETLTGVIKGMDWIEREMHELLGVDFRGRPRLERLLLPEQWPEGVHPLRANYREWDKTAVRDRGV